VPFFLSISLIIKGSHDVHDDVANLFRNLRRLRWGSDDEVEGARRRITGQAFEPANARALASTSQIAPLDSRKRIDELLKALRDEIQKLDSAPPGSHSVPLGR